MEASSGADRAGFAQTTDKDKCTRALVPIAGGHRAATLVQYRRRTPCPGSTTEGAHMNGRLRRVRCLWLLPFLAGGCIDLGAVDDGGLFPRGEPFIISGTAAVEDRDGPCRAWLGENGVTYHLFQGARVANDEFDRVRTEGVTSRLEIAIRTDLQLDCQYGTIVEVQRVLEIGD